MELICLGHFGMSFAYGGLVSGLVKEKEVGSREKGVKFQIPPSPPHNLFIIAGNLHIQPKTKI